MKRVLKNLFLIIFITAYIFLYVFYVSKDYLRYSESITASFFVITTFIAYLFYGYFKDKRAYIKKSVMQIVITQLAIFFVVIYGVGLVVGFLKNSYSLALPSIIDNLFAPIVLIIAMEILRYIFISANKDKKFFIVLLTILFIVMDVLMSNNRLVFNNAEIVFKLFTTSIIPITLKHSVMSYLTYKVGYKPSLLYRIIVDGYVYIVPISPDLGDYLSSMAGIALPFIVYLYSSRFLNEYDNGVEREFAIATTFRFVDLIFIGFFLLLAALISGYFPLFILGVGSASMEPAINIGDAIVASKVNSIDDLKKDDIVVYNGDNKTIVHRIVDIEKKDGKSIIHTKGDNNNTNDSFELYLEDIRGKVLFRIPYIAYPSVYISEYFEKEK